MKYIYRIGGVMVSVFALSARVDSGWIKPKTMQLVFALYRLSTRHKVMRTKVVGSVSVRVQQYVYPWTVVSVSKHYSTPTKHVNLVLRDKEEISIN